MKFKHFRIEEREKIQELLWQKTSVRAIAKTLNRSPSSVAREINRNMLLKRSYKPRVADERAQKKRKSRGRKLRLKNQFIRRYVITNLKAGLSPEQIAGRLHVEHPEEKISHEAIYQYIYSHVHRQGWGLMKIGYHDLRKYLKRRHKRRAQRGMRSVQRVFRPKGPSIDDRPQEVETRKTVGHWETDSVISRKSKVGLNTLVERKTGLVFITKIEDHTSEVTKNAVVKRLSALPKEARKSATSDNGTENFLYDEAQFTLDILWFFAHPYHSWERGTNENTNGLIRWYFPKGTDFATIPDETIKVVEDALNNRPRKRLGWKTPLEVFNESVAFQY
ncbi:MAG: IS30 family transposase [bacterium]|nr:IS30 family transposase [bacterium]